MVNGTCPLVERLVHRTSTGLFSLIAKHVQQMGKNALNDKNHPKMGKEKK